MEEVKQACLTGSKKNWAFPLRTGIAVIAVRAILTGVRIARSVVTVTVAIAIRGVVDAVRAMVTGVSIVMVAGIPVAGLALVAIIATRAVWVILTGVMIARCAITAMIRVAVTTN